MKKKSKAPKAKAEPSDLAMIVPNIKRTFRDDISNIIKRGELLQLAKDKIEDGEWLTRLEANFNWDEEMAQRAMSVAKFAAKYDTVSALNLSKGVLYGLAAGGFPDKIVSVIRAVAPGNGMQTVSAMPTGLFLIAATVASNAWLRSRRQPAAVAVIY